MLVVDDEPSIRAVLQRMLMLKGLCSVAVANEDDATAAAEQESFAAYVVDVDLKRGGSGIDWLGWLRGRASATTAPVFVLTGDHHLREDEQTLLRTREAKVYFKGESLLALVERIKESIAAGT